MKKRSSLRRLMSLLLCLVMLVQTVAVASAADFSPASETPEPTAASAFQFSDGEITDYVGKDANVVIPAAIDGVTVKKIGQAAFMAKDIENVVIPGTVTYVDDYAFDYCDSLEGLYFYGACPVNLSSATYDMNTGVTVYCKGTYLSDYAYEVGDYFTVSGTIKNDLADPAYPAPASHNWIYTDNGDGTHSATCADEGCTEVITNQAHTYTDGVCPCGAKLDPSAPNFFTYSVKDGEAAITGYTGPGGEITLPGTYTADGVTYPVTSVADRAFNGSNGTNAEALSKITKITVPASVTTVGDYAFNYVGRYMTRLWSLKEIVFQADNVSFGTAALGANPNLTTVILPSGQTEIGSSLFAKDTALAEITLPTTVTKVGQLAFQDCTALRKVTFLSSAAPELGVSTGYNGGQYPFVGCQSLVLRVSDAKAYRTAWAAMLATDSDKTGDITLADEGGVAYIPDFKGYVNGTDASTYNPQYLEYRVLSFDNTGKTGTVELKYVGWNSANKALVIPETVTTRILGDDWTFTVVSIGESAINDYKISDYSSSKYSFPSVTFPGTLTEIHKQGCWGLEKVTEIDLSGTKVVAIGDQAFNGCKSLVTVKLPKTLESMGGTGTVDKKSESVDTKDNNNSDTKDETTGTGGESISYTDNVFAYCNALQNILVDKENKSFKDIDGVLYTADGKKLIRYPNGRTATHYDIPEGVEVIASQAFMVGAGNNYSSALQTVKFPSTLKEVESLAFRQSWLTEVTIPAGVKFGSSVFDNNDKLTKVTVENGVTELPDYMFWGCDSLGSVQLPDSLKKIGKSCFEHSALNELNLNQVEELGDHAFYYTKLTDVTIPASVTKVGTGVFCNIATLTKVTFADGATTVGDYMFFYDTALVDLTLPNSIKNIGQFAFGYCVVLPGLTMPASLETMGDGVFYKCWKSLDKVTFPDTVKLTCLPAQTFESCQALVELNLGSAISATGAVSLYDTNAKLKVTSGLTEKTFARHIFDVYPYDLSDGDLFTSCVKTGDVDGNGYPIYKVTLNEDAFSGGGGCGGGSVSTEDGVLIYAGANPTFVYGQGKGPVALQLKIQLCDGKTQTIDIYKSDLMELAVDGVIVYQFWPPVSHGGGTRAVVGTKYVPIDALLEKYGVSKFAAADSLGVAAPDTADKPFSVTGKELETCKYYFDANGNRQEIPAALLLSWNSGTLVNGAGQVLTTVEDLAGTAYDSGNIRFGYGVSQEQYDSRETTGLRGMRLISGVSTLSFVQEHVYVDAPADTYLASAATCTENAKYYTKVCQTCGAGAEPVEKTGTALGHDLINGAYKSDANQHWRVCSHDGCTEVGARADHTWNSGVITTQPTTTAEGVKTFTCTVCQATRTESVDKLPGGTTTGGSSTGGNTTGGTTTGGSNAATPGTGDAGVALYVCLGVLTLMGGAWVGSKRRNAR